MVESHFKDPLLQEWEQTVCGETRQRRTWATSVRKDWPAKSWRRSMASEPKVGDVRQDGSLRQQVWLGSGWYYVGSPIATKLVSAELSAVREMREVLRRTKSRAGMCPECFADDDEDCESDCRLARLIGGGE